MRQFFIKQNFNRNKVKWHLNALTLYLSYRILPEKNTWIILLSDCCPV